MSAAARPRPRLEGAPHLAFWREALVGFDWMSLRTSAVYYGFGVPRGDGAPVVVVPGFLGSDRYLMELYHWLDRLGYRPYYSRIGRNADCPDLLLRRLLATIKRARRETGRKVHVVGHSLGGTLARSAAIQQPGLIDRVISLGSPVNAARVHPAVLAAANLVRGRVTGSGRRRPFDCFTDECECSFVSSVGEVPPPSVFRASIYTKSDGVVDWRCCLDEDDEANVEVKGTHCGLAFNPQVYRLIARLLQADRPRAPRRPRLNADASRLRRVQAAAPRAPARRRRASRAN